MQSIPNNNSVYFKNKKTKKLFNLFLKKKKKKKKKPFYQFSPTIPIICVFEIKTLLFYAIILPVK
jgi:hypothetical protein